MKIVTWKRDHGHTFAVLFANGETAAEYIGPNPKTGEPYIWTKKQAEAAGEKFRERKGNNWELGNMNYNVTDVETGEVTRVFKHVSLVL